MKKMFVCVFFVGGKSPGGFLKTQQKVTVILGGVVKLIFNGTLFLLGGGAGGGKRSKLIYNWGHNPTHRGARTCERFPSVEAEQPGRIGNWRNPATPAGRKGLVLY